MESKRQARFARAIQKELGEIFLREGKKLFGSGFISVTTVRVSPDLGYVKVYLSFMNEKHPEKMVSLIRQHNKEIRMMLAGRIKDIVRKIPELEFFYDDTMDFVERMDHLFDELKPSQKAGNTEEE